MTLVLMLACTSGSQDSALPTDSVPVDTSPARDPLPVDPVPMAASTCIALPRATGVPALSGISDDSPVTRADLALLLTAPSPATLTCTAADDPTEEHRLDSPTPALEHRWTVHGLLASQAYDCVARPTCDDQEASVTLTTGDLPVDLVEGTVTTDPERTLTGAYTLYNTKGFCDGEQPHRFVIVDPEGRIRWYWDGVDPDYGVGVVANYLGDDQVFAAGGTDVTAGPRILHLDGDPLYRTPTDWGITFHHYGEVLSNAHFLSVAEATDTLDGETWEGVHVVQHDPETDTIVQEWRSQQAVDAGEYQVFDVGTTGENLNVNWVSRDTDGDWYASLCGAQRIARIDPSSGDVVWVIGPELGWTLVDDAGGALTSDDWPQCQHGAEVLAPNQVLVYDNGRDRLEARAAEYRVDPDTRTVTRTWVWTEPEWYEQAWGDVDALSEDRVLLGIGHCSCCRPASDNVTRILEVDRPSGSVVWRYALPADDSILYQASRIDGCAVFHNTRYCPERVD